MSTSAALIACLQCVHIACTLYRNAIISTSAALNSCLQCVHITCIFQCKCYNQHSRSPQFMPNVFMPYVVHNRNTTMSTSAALKSCLQCVHIICNLQQKRHDEQFLNTRFMATWCQSQNKVMQLYSADCEHTTGKYSQTTSTIFGISFNKRLAKFKKQLARGCEHQFTKNPVSASTSTFV